MLIWLYEMGANVINYSLEPLSNEDHFNLLNLKKINHIEADILDQKKLIEVFKSTDRK